MSLKDFIYEEFKNIDEAEDWAIINDGSLLSYNDDKQFMKYINEEFKQQQHEKNLLIISCRIHFFC